MDSMRRVDVFGPSKLSQHDVACGFAGFPDANRYYTGMIHLEPNSLLVLKGRLPSRIELLGASLDQITAALSDTEIWSVLKRAHVSTREGKADIKVVLTPYGTGTNGRETFEKIYGHDCDQLKGFRNDEYHLASVEWTGHLYARDLIVFKQVARSVVTGITSMESKSYDYNLVVTGPKNRINLISRGEFLRNLNEVVPVDA